MDKKELYIAAFFLFFLNLNLLNAQDKLISTELIQSYTTSDIQNFVDANGIPSSYINMNYPVDAYKVIYKTTNYDGSSKQVSGVVFVPIDGQQSFPLLSYQHGSISKREDVPSRMNLESTIGLIFATEGYTTCMPDYIGLGNSSGLHPYHHARTEANSVIDLILATREMNESISSMNLNDELYLSGYSQGGHATMAAHKLIEEEYAEQISVNASVPMAGAYDMSGVQSAVITEDNTYTTPAYLPYVLFSYDMVYDLYADVSDVLVSPYDTTLPTLFNGNYSLSEISAEMPAIPNQILKPAVLNDFRTDDNHFLRVALRDNDLYDWTPQAKMHLLYCGGDHTVVPENSIIAYNKFLENGAEDVTIANVNDALNHSECALYAIFSSKIWFNVLRYTNSVEQISKSSDAFFVYPNPINENSVLAINDNSIRSFTYQIISSGGQVILEKKVVKTNAYLNFVNTNLPSGVYFLKITSDSGQVYLQKLLKM